MRLMAIHMSRDGTLPLPLTKVFTHIEGVSSDCNDLTIAIGILYRGFGTPIAKQDRKRGRASPLLDIDIRLQDRGTLKIED